MNSAVPLLESTTTIEVQLLGQKMALKATDGEAHLERVIAYVKTKIDEISPGGPVPTGKVALLLALNIADDYLKATEQAAAFREEVAQRAKFILQELDVQFS